MLIGLDIGMNTFAALSVIALLQLSPGLFACHAALECLAIFANTSLDAANVLCSAVSCTLFGWVLLGVVAEADAKALWSLVCQLAHLDLTRPVALAFRPSPFPLPFKPHLPLPLPLSLAPFCW